MIVTFNAVSEFSLMIQTQELKIYADYAMKLEIGKEIGLITEGVSIVSNSSMHFSALDRKAISGTNLQL